MNRSFFVALALALQAGCGGDTTLLLDLSLAPALAQPEAVRVTLYSQGVVGAPQMVPVASAGRMLPGRLVVRPLDPALSDPRVLVDGLDAHGRRVSEAASRLELAAGRQTDLPLVLDRPLPDADGDGVPDIIDDCPQLADPDQHCGVPPPDGGDLAVPTDGAPPDLLRGPPCPTPHLFCDDFESGNAGKWTGKSVKANSMLAVDNQLVWGGHFALDVSAVTNPADGGGFASTAASLDEAISPSLKTLAARMYVRVPEAPGSFAMFLGLFAGTEGFAIGINGTNRWVVTQNQGGLPDVSSTVTMPIDQWVCLEFILDPPDPSHPQGRGRVLTDGITILDFAPAGYVTPTELDVGLVRAPGNQTSHVYVDDVALAAQPIGCE